MNDLQKKLRQRILETLEFISSKPDQLEYQQKVPYVCVSDELFNQWDDWYHPEDKQFCGAFFTDELGPVTIVGPGAGRRETGFALLIDLLEINRKS